MAYQMYCKITGNKQKLFPGTCGQTVQGVDEVKPDQHSLVLSCNYRVHGGLDKITGRPTGTRTHEPFSIVFEMDENYARYMAALTTGEELTVELVFVKNLASGEGGFSRALKLEFTRTYIADITLETGQTTTGSSSSAKGGQEFVTPELYTVRLAYSKIKGDSGHDGKGSVLFEDDWAKLGKA